MNVFTWGVCSAKDQEFASICEYRDHLDLLALLGRTEETVCQDPLDPLDLVVAVERLVPL